MLIHDTLTRLLTISKETEAKEREQRHAREEAALEVQRLQKNVNNSATFTASKIPARTPAIVVAPVTAANLAIARKSNLDQSASSQSDPGSDDGSSVSSHRLNFASPPPRLALLAPATPIVAVDPQLQKYMDIVAEQRKQTLQVSLPRVPVYDPASSAAATPTPAPKPGTVIVSASPSVVSTATPSQRSHSVASNQSYSEAFEADGSGIDYSMASSNKSDTAEIW